ncbi:hypothetical protein F4680DRAFT_440137 [Xylaria scruposa]|nr:hypothetical protein F4680DRAFT_440137 [Xylaria scruposa]
MHYISYPGLLFLIHLPGCFACNNNNNNSRRHDLSPRNSATAMCCRQIPYSEYYSLEFLLSYIGQYHLVHLSMSMNNNGMRDGF